VTLRIDRAGEHLEDLETRVAAFVESQRDSIVFEANEIGIRIENVGDDPPATLGVIVGEVLYNLRAALDYLVYALAWLDSEAHQAHTQFLIEDSPEVFDSKRSWRLKGLSDEHAAAIKRLQPFDGPNWLRVLRETSNRDKHWALHFVTAQGSGHFEFDPPISSANLDALRAGEVDVKHTGSVEITFDDGTPILEALQQLHSEVRALVEAFKPEFER
jgi:hypothetical protein